MRTLAIVIAIVSVLAAAQIGQADGSDQTIGDIISLPDGTPVTLCLETIIRIQHEELPNYIVLQEPFHGQDKLVVLTIPNSVLRLQQEVDVSGNLTTLASGARALENVTVWGYATATGQLLYHPPLIKAFGLPGETPWPKIDLTVASPSGTGGPTTRNRALDYTPQEDTDTSPPLPTVYATVDSVVNAAPPLDESSLVALECKPIVANGVETIGGVDHDYIDIMDDDGTSTQRVYYDPAVYPSAATALRLNYISGQIRSNGYMQTLCVNAGPNYDVQTFLGVMQPVGYMDYTTNPPKPIPSIPSILTLPDDQTGAVTSTQPFTLTGRVVSATNTDFPGYQYIQEPGRFSSTGIRVKGISSAARGALVDITGFVNTGSDGEREIDATAITAETSTPVPPIPFGMSNAVLGGQINGYVKNITNPFDVGCYNRGLLVKCLGQVTYVDPSGGFFYIWDGSNLSGGTALQDIPPDGPPGVRVDCSWPVTRKPIVIPILGQYVSVTGISGSESVGNRGGLSRVLRVRDQADLVPSSLAVSIQTPSGSTWHMASDRSDIVIGGMATEPGGTVASVQVGFGATGSNTQPGTWSAPVSYSSATHMWSYDWQTPQSERIWVKATDSAGKVVTTYLDVTVVLPGVIYVSAASSDSPLDGSSWARAYHSVQTAITTAGNMTPKAEVWVAAGTYAERITLQDGVAVYGGFTGTEMSREQRDWNGHPTILDSQHGGTVVTAPNGVSPSARIDGFTLQNGSGPNGGGIYCHYASPTISNNRITGNTSPYGGGGIYCDAFSAPAISNNVINGNSATSGSGGGIYCSACSPVISNNSITGNTTPFGGGGAIACYSGSATISGNDIIGNSGSYSSGGIYCYNCSAMTISNNQIEQNTTQGNGGGIYCSACSPVISGNTITLNYAPHGGGIYCDASAAGLIRMNMITNNTGGCGIYCSQATPRIADNGIAGNQSGGIYCSNSPCEISNDTIAGNPGIGIFLSSSNATITNTIVASNTGAGISGSAPLLQHNDVYGQNPNYSSGITHTTDINADPWLSGDHVHFIPLDQLTPGQTNPCKDAGLNSVVQSGDIDVDGNGRIQDLVVDIGAQELNNCAHEALTLTADHVAGAIGSTLSLTAYAYDPQSRMPVISRQISFSVSGGSVVSISPGGRLDTPPTSGSGITGPDGKVSITVTSSVANVITVTASMTTRCGNQVSAPVNLSFFGFPVEIFFCMDSTGSMGQQGGSGNHRATASVAQFLTDLTNQGVIFRLGGVKFNGPNGLTGVDSINSSEFASLASFSSVPSFISSWVNDSYSPAGGDDPELQLDALDEAVQDMNAHSTPGNPNRYIVLATDNVFHYLNDQAQYGTKSNGGSILTVSGIESELAASGCRVYISLYDNGSTLLVPMYNSQYTRLRQVYQQQVIDASGVGLGVNGDFDTVNLGDADLSTMYTFDKLRARIMAN